MEQHLDVHPDDFASMLPVIGKVVGVYPKDHAENPTGTLTLYQVEIYLHSPAFSCVIPFAPYLGQSAGKANASEDPLLVGQYVVVAFLEGDPNRPYIQGIWFDQETNVAGLSADYPTVRHERNGTIATIDKGGNVEVRLASQKSFKLVDSNGVVIFQLVHSGGQYEVHLGGSVDLRPLITDALIAQYDAHVHTGGTLGGGFTGVPTALLVGVSTTIAKAK
jgi:hypothetical protein